MTELSFLIDLLLHHKLPKATQTAIKSRIDEVQTVHPWTSPTASDILQFPKPPSTFSIKSNPAPATAPIVPIEQVAQNATTQAALAQRQAMIDAAVNRKVIPGTTSAPKVHGNQ